MTAVILFLLFSMYTPPFLYLFVFTDSITGFLFNVLQMSKLKSSILISFQYSIIIFLTAKIYRVKATKLYYYMTIHYTNKLTIESIAIKWESKTAKSN